MPVEIGGWGTWKYAGLLMIVVATGGCARQSPASYSLRKETQELPTKQRAEAADYLERLYGTYRFPRLRTANLAPSSSETEGPVAASSLQLKDQVEPARLEHGREIYTQQCFGCHGVTGAGDGPAAQYLDPPPRDYRKGVFKFTSTPRGRKPRHEDLVRIVRKGAKGTSMPAFPWMAHDDLEDLIAYVKSLSSRGQMELALIQESEDNLSVEDDPETPEDEIDSYDPERVAELANGIDADWTEAASLVVLPQTPMVPYNEQTIELGARAFVKESCYKCHGIDGRGNRQFNVGKDEWGRTAYAANIAAGMLHGGRRPIDIYRRIYTGINGTPMPGFGSTLEAQGKLDTIWHLTHFVTSIVEGRELPAELLKELAAESEAAARRELEGQQTPPEEPTSEPSESTSPSTTESESNTPSPE
jgi:mono/diheme cytochrome c family protein